MQTATQTLAAPLGFYATLSGLTANTTYDFQAKANGGTAGTSYGAILSFTTGKIPPSVSTNGANAVTADSATLNGTLTSPGTALRSTSRSSTAPLPAYTAIETTPQAMTATGDFSAPIGGLAAATTYYFRAKGNGTFTAPATGPRRSSPLPPYRPQSRQALSVTSQPSKHP